MPEGVIFAADGSNIKYKRIRYKIRNKPKYQYRTKITRIGEKRPYAYVKWTPKKKEMEKRILERTRKELKKTRISIEPIKEKEVKKGLYRSTLIYDYSKRDVGRYSVWVYSEMPDVTKSEMWEKLNLLFDRYPTNMRDALQEDRWEGNEEIDPDEKPSNEDINVFYGKVEFRSKSGIKRQYPVSGLENLGGR